MEGIREYGDYDCERFHVSSHGILTVEPRSLCIPTKDFGLNYERLTGIKARYGSGECFQQVIRPPS